MSNGRLKVFLLGASFSTRNMGVGALAAGVLKSLKSSYPDAELVLMDYARERETFNYSLNGRNVLVPLVNIRFSRKFYLSNNIALLVCLAALARAVPLKGFRRAVISGNSTLTAMDEADLIASIAGGDSFSDLYGLGRFFYVTLPQVLAILLGKRLVLLPQTIGPFKTKLARSIARFVMGKAQTVYSRDYLGLLEARDLLEITGKSGKFRFCYDLGFVLDPVRPVQMDREDLACFEKNGHPAVVGLNVSALLYMGGYTGDNMFGLKTSYRELVTGTLELLLRGKGLKVVLVPHVFGPGSHKESDSALCATLHEKLKQEYGDSIALIRGTYDQNGIKHLIGNCDFFIGSRMHACIAALSQEIPTVCISYSRKFAGVMESLGIEKYVADPGRMEKTEILKLIEDSYEERALLKEKLKSAMPQVRERVLHLFEEIIDG